MISSSPAPLCPGVCPASLFALLALCLTPGFVVAQGGPYLAQNGLVVVQAESLPLAGDWVIETTEAGYTGAGYLRWNGPNELTTPGNGSMAITFQIDEPGDYFVTLRMSHFGAPAGDQENDCWMKVDDGDWDKAVHPSSRMNEGFTFHTVLEPSGGEFISPLFTFDAGLHTVFSRADRPILSSTASISIEVTCRILKTCPTRNRHRKDRAVQTAP